MTVEERKAHDATKRRERQDSKSRQKRTAEKSSRAAYMRQWRLEKKTHSQISVTPPCAPPNPCPSNSTSYPAAPSTPIMPIPLATSSPFGGANGPILQRPPVATSTPIERDDVTARGAPLATSTPKGQKMRRYNGCPNLPVPKTGRTRLRQHAYNTCSKVRHVSRKCIHMYVLLLISL